jgi:hypothetical protein
MAETLKSVMDLAKLGCINLTLMEKRINGDPVYLIEGKEYRLHKEDDAEDEYIFWILLEVGISINPKPDVFVIKLLRQDVENRNNLTPMQQHFLSNDDEFKARLMFGRI